MVIDTGGLIALSKSQAGLIKELVVTTTTVRKLVVTTTTVRKHGAEDKAKLGMKTLLNRGCTCFSCLLAYRCCSWTRVAR